jgi:TolB-like protein/Tfp pilus assembly protein PilF
VWAGRVVEENTLTQAISTLRRALGTGAGDHRYIVTVPGRGYRFVADASDGSGEIPLTRRAGDLPAVLATDVLESATATDAVVAPEPAFVAAPASHRRRWLLGGLLAALALLALAAGWRERLAAPQATLATAKPAFAAAPTILAVLPFRALSVGARDEWLELGLTETLITRLSRSPGLQVPGLASAQQLAGTADPQQAGRRIGARYVVEGSTQRIGDQVRVNARLLATDTGKVLWSQTFDARLDRVFTLQDQIGDAVTSALALGPIVASAYPRSPCDGADALAYRAYLRGYYELHRPTGQRLTEALAAFREAIDRDPTCARAWAGTSYAYRTLVMTADRDPREMFPLAKAAVARALAIDPNSAEAYTSKGFIEFWYDWDWVRAEASLRKAIALNPNLAEAQSALAHLLVNLGRAQEAVPYARRAIALDPLSPIVNSLAGAFLDAAGLRQEAQRQIDKTLELEPDSWVAMRIRNQRLTREGKYREALTELQRALQVSGGSSQILNLMGDAYMKVGDRAAAEAVAAELERRRRQGYVPATSLAKVYLALGNKERALDLLEQGYAERDVRMSFLLIDWPTLRDEPRFQALLRRMRLADGKDQGAD